MHLRTFTAAALPFVLLTACSGGSDTAANTAAQNLAAPVGQTAAPTPTPTATEAATPAVAGFDPASAPIANPTLGGFPYLGLLEGYHAITKDEAGSWEWENQKDVAYDRYEFFDGTKLIPVEGRLRTVEAVGTGKSFFEAEKNYEKLIHDMGGVTVWEGPGTVMEERKLDFSERRHRNRYTSVRWEKMGVYMVRTPTKEIWVEVYQTNDIKPDNYWVTIVEKKALEVSVKMVPAEALKKALDSAGHVAVYLNFDTDKTVVRPESQPAIGEIVKLLTADPSLKLTVEGHTDDAGSPAHNQTLSQGRANAVMGLLIAQGIDPTRLVAKGLGQTKPIADNSSEDGKAKNRRVELVKR